MLLWTVIKVAMRSLWANKLRTGLSMLGIIIGVASVISLLSLASGVRKQFMDNWKNLGANLLTVRRGASEEWKVKWGQQRRLTLGDAQALLHEVPAVEAISPLTTFHGEVSHRGKAVTIPVLGVADTYFSLRNFELEKGRAFSHNAVANMSRVIVLGPQAAQDLFGKSDPLGQSVRAQNLNLRVIGVTKSKGDSGWNNPDNQAFAPYPVIMRQMLGTSDPHVLDVRVDATADPETTKRTMRRVLRRRHRLPLEAPDDFHIHDMAEIKQQADQSLMIFEVLMGGIGSISLLVGGIGIMNVMLATVAERTREIGVRKAIGAKDWHILGQFLLESVVISGLGGLIGIALGAGIGEIITTYTPAKSLIEVGNVGLAVGVATAVGVFFGFYPAWQAARLDPIEALRVD